MLKPMSEFDTSTQIAAIMRGIVAYSTSDRIALIRTSGRTRIGTGATYLIRVRDHACPRIKALSDAEAITKANAWLTRNRKRWEEEIALLKPMFPNASLSKTER
jgi:hypothetical protein